MLREEEERAERAEKAKAASQSGASRDVHGDASRRRSDARSALRTHPEETLDDPNANANEPPRTHQSTKLWNEEELEHVMEDVAVRRPRRAFFCFLFFSPLRRSGCPLSFFCFVFESKSETADTTRSFSPPTRLTVFLTVFHFSFVT